jgi:hypothetical protein
MSKSKFFLVTFEGNVMRKVDINKMKEDMIGTIDDQEDEPWREKEAKKDNKVVAMPKITSTSSRKYEPEFTRLLGNTQY